jgi:HD-GYP domain-containing protein (c-di-GMP phosphodiesterase class II)
LGSDEVLLGAKVIMVADVVEAMASHRPYRAALGVDAALEEIEAGSGIRYDAEVSQACLALFRLDEFEFTAS